MTPGVQDFRYADLDRRAYRRLGRSHQAWSQALEQVTLGHTEVDRAPDAHTLTCGVEPGRVGGKR